MNNYDNQNNQNNYNAQGRDPLPQYNYQAPNGNYYNQGYNYQQPVQQAQVNPVHQAEVDAHVGSAFGKGLAAAIMCEFPVASIIAIILGAAGGSAANRAVELGALYGVEVSGKNTAGRILSKIGMIVGIVMTVIWSFYFLMILALL